MIDNNQQLRAKRLAFVTVEKASSAARELKHVNKFYLEDLNQHGQSDFREIIKSIPADEVHNIKDALLEVFKELKKIEESIDSARRI